jgi:ATP-dependent helicase HrpA
VLSSGRMVAYGRVDPTIARDMFIRHGLVERDWQSRHRFLERNARTLKRIAELAQRTRRGVTFDAESLFEFYADRLPVDVVSGRHFDRWWARHRQSEPQYLTISDQVLAEMGMDPNATPDEWVQGDLRLRVMYRYDPGSALDGISVQIPIGLLNQVSTKGTDWLVPAYRNELVETVVRGLPKAVRRDLGPIAAVVNSLTSQLRSSGPVMDQVMREQSVVRWVTHQLGLTQVDIAALQSQLPTHLKMKFVVVDGGGQVLDAGSDLAAIRSRQTAAMRAALIAATGFVERHDLDHWAVGVVPTQVLGPSQEIGYPALIDEGRTVGLSLMASPMAQRNSHRGGVRRLLLASVAPSRKALLAKVTATEQLAVAGTEFGLRDLAIDASIAAVDRVLDDHGLVWDAAAYRLLEAEVRNLGPQIAADLFSAAIAVAAMAGAITERCEAMTADSLMMTAEDARAHLNRLVRPGFVVTVGSRRLPDLARYVAGIAHRLDRLAGEIDRDHHRIAQVAPLEARYRNLMRHFGGGAGMSEAAQAKLEELGWTMEELRLFVFAQALGARPGVSVTKVDRLLSAWGF